LLTESREHLAAVDEDYLEHMRFAGTVGGILLVAGLCCLVHSMVPALFPTSASRRIRLLNAAMQNRSLIAEQSRSLGEIAIFIGLCGMAVAITFMVIASGAAPFVAGSLSLVAFSYPAAFLISCYSAEPPAQQQFAPAN